MATGRRLLHAVTRTGAGLDEPGPDRIDSGPLQAVCSPVDSGADEGDPEWLAAAAQRHHQIIQRLFDSGPVLPIRFGTLIEVEAISALLERHESTFTAELNRLDGLSEWGVKLMADPATLKRAAEESSKTVRELDEELAASTPGKAYLLKRRREAAVAEAIERHRAATVDRVRNMLAQSAADSDDLPLPPVQPAERAMLANIAFLVPNAQVDAFSTAADKAASEAAVELELSGPWPPYSFVRLNLTEADS